MNEMNKREGRRRTAIQPQSKLLLACFLLSVIGGVSCEPQAYRLIDTTPMPIEAPDGYYHDIAWLTFDQLALIHSETLETPDSARRIMILDRKSDTQYVLPHHMPPECARVFNRRINRLSNQQLGYLWECIPHSSGGRDFRLHQYDLAERSDQELYRYPIPFWATAFSFESMMERWLQEEAGDGLSNSLHLVRQDEEPVRLLEASFARAGHPFWLSDDQIVFAGTPNLPESGFNLFSGLPSIRASLNESWTIYLTNLESLLSDSVGEEQAVLSDIQYVAIVKTSPDGRYLSFLGTVDGNQGLWVYEFESGDLARLWVGDGPYDWSPEGDAIMVLVRQPEEPLLFYGRPARIELPASLTE